MAGSNLGTALIVIANILDKVGPDCTFSLGIMSSIDNNPRNILMSWLKLFSGNCIVINILDSLISGGTFAYLAPVEIQLFSTFLSLGHPVRGRLLETDQIVD